MYLTKTMMTLVIYDTKETSKKSRNNMEYL